MAFQVGCVLPKLLGHLALDILPVVLASGGREFDGLDGARWNVDWMYTVLPRATGLCTFARSCWTNFIRSDFRSKLWMSHRARAHRARAQVLAELQSAGEHEKLHALVFSFYGLSKAMGSLGLKME